MLREGLDFASLSAMIGRNASYVQQYMKYGKPRNLPEREREALGQLFKVDPDIFRQNYRPRDAQSELLALYERVPEERQDEFLELVRQAARLATPERAVPTRPGHPRRAGVKN
jgi:hypothetical protein